MSEPKITKLATESQISKFVELIISNDPIEAEGQANAFIELIMAVADLDDDNKGYLAKHAMRTAYNLTMAYEYGFRDFAKWHQPTTTPVGRQVIQNATEIGEM